MPGQKFKIIVADDHPLVREGIIQLINRQPDMACCAEADSSAAIFSAVPKFQPHLLILDLRLRDEDGLEMIKRLRTEHPGLRILVLSQFQESIYSLRVLKAGAHGYVMKQEASLTIIAAARRVLQGGLAVSDKVKESALEQAITEKRAAPAPAPVDSLSDRELQVLLLLGNDLSTRDIAAKLRLSPKTVETYRENLKHKLGLRNSAALLEYARQWARRSGA